MEEVYLKLELLFLPTEVLWSLQCHLYGADDNPKNVTKIHLEYFEEAIQFLKNQPQVSIK
jgi:hypothetical protein